MYYAGFDIACKGSYLFIQDRRGKKVEGREIPTTKQAIREAFKKYQGSLIEVAVETGNQTRWIFDELRRLGVRVYIVNTNIIDFSSRYIRILNDSQDMYNFHRNFNLLYFEK